MSETQSIRFSVNTGGTFTDIVALDEVVARESLSRGNGMS